MTIPTINIIGAGASGVYLTMFLSQHKVKVNLFDLGKQPCRKIRISGGGFCNFTNLEIDKEFYLSQNPYFCISALTRHTNWDFLSFVLAHEESIGIKYKDNTKVFTANGANQLIKVMLEQIEYNSLYSHAQINWHWEQEITTISAQNYKTLNNSYTKNNTQITNRRQQVFTADFTVIASGGLAMPKLKVSDNFKQLKLTHQYVQSRPGLVPLAYIQENAFYKSISGISLPVIITNQDQKKSFFQDLLFTHQGISGPAVLQISNWWQPGETIYINLLPHINLEELVTCIKHNKDKQAQQWLATQQLHVTSNILVKNLLSLLLPKRLVELWLNVMPHSKFTTTIYQKLIPILQKQVSQLNKTELAFLTQFIQHHPFIATKDLGYDKAEVMLGGINTKNISSKTMELQELAQVYAIGEVIDVTGFLGGYNFQWCWSSAYACYCDIMHKLGENPINIKEMVERTT